MCHNYWVHTSLTTEPTHSGALAPQLERENLHATTREKPACHNKEPVRHNEDLACHNEDPACRSEDQKEKKKNKKKPQKKAPKNNSFSTSQSGTPWNFHPLILVFFPMVNLFESHGVLWKYKEWLWIFPPEKYVYMQNSHVLSWVWRAPWIPKLRTLDL